MEPLRKYNVEMKKDHKAIRLLAFSKYNIALLVHNKNNKNENINNEGSNNDNNNKKINRIERR